MLLVSRFLSEIEQLISLQLSQQMKKLMNLDVNFHQLDALVLNEFDQFVTMNHIEHIWVIQPARRKESEECLFKVLQLTKHALLFHNSIGYQKEITSLNLTRDRFARRPNISFHVHT